MQKAATHQAQLPIGDFAQTVVSEIVLRYAMPSIMRRCHNSSSACDRLSSSQSVALASRSNENERPIAPPFPPVHTPASKAVPDAR